MKKRCEVALGTTAITRLRGPRQQSRTAAGKDQRDDDLVCLRVPEDYYIESVLSGSLCRCHNTHLVDRLAVPHEFVSFQRGGDARFRDPDHLAQTSNADAADVRRRWKRDQIFNYVAHCDLHFRNE